MSFENFLTENVNYIKQDRFVQVLKKYKIDEKSDTKLKEFVVAVWNFVADSYINKKEYNLFQSADNFEEAIDAFENGSKIFQDVFKAADMYYQEIITDSKINYF